MKRSRATRIGLQFLLVFIGIAVGWGVVEMAVRLESPPPEVAQFRDIHELRADKPWIYGLRPSASQLVTTQSGKSILYRINAAGFRDRDYSIEKPAGAYRIVVMGDSVTFGFGVNQQQGYAALLEDRLARDLPGSNVQVLNFGVGGYNTYTEEQLLKDVGVRYQPDLVVAQFSINDLSDPTLHFDFHARYRLGALPDDAYPDPSKRLRAAGDMKWSERLCYRSVACGRIYDFFIMTTRSELTENLVDNMKGSIVDSDRIEWTWLEERYAEMASVSHTAGAEFAVLAAPFRSQLTNEAAREVQPALVALGERNGWPTIDPLASLLSAHERGEKLFSDPWHPTPLGHRLIAREAGTALACADLLPNASRLCSRAGR